MNQTLLSPRAREVRKAWGRAGTSGRSGEMLLALPQLPLPLPSLPALPGGTLFLLCHPASCHGVSLNPPPQADIP